MKQAIAGVAPPELGEVTIMTVWPSMAKFAPARWLGRRYQNQTGIPPVLTLGRFMALASIPVSLGMFAAKLAWPGFCRRYRLTNRRVIIEKPPRIRDVALGLFKAKWTEEWSVDLDDFDEIEVVVLPGQEWYPAGDLVFRHGKLETFRLLAVQRPETFRRTCLKAQQAYAAVKKAVAREPVHA